MGEALRRSADETEYSVDSDNKCRLGGSGEVVLRLQARLSTKAIRTEACAVQSGVVSLCSESVYLR